ncbi:MAG TPA: NAD(P)/FAD-dependent oxidoreductase [Candidatus Alistipes intestinigallinarum]|uniref:NAD(P)/FAD-dependent oxidoreductase n=1 Tax=Candidatus Alistipes intestinigallinarum TaxID=2838440 RepID=A0A9D2CBX1_9BACT|nr:NAD(P)/FAD-dependent oxidoreductase [Candidatus Alistipes intestinigallinarum]
MEQQTEKQGFDVIVVGAGAAGLMAAGTAAQQGRRVLLLEKMEKSGRKVRITGKGRCNVTNARPAEEFASQVRTNAEFFAPAFAGFDNRATIRFFERRGVKLEIERGERVFPKSGKAWDIANALLDYCVENGVEIRYDTRVTGILTLAGRVFGVKYINKRGFERKEECPAVILATGGVSYPATGSTGDGYAFAADLGHTIEPLRPSLTPLVTSHPQVRYLHKLLLRNIRATLYIDNAPVREEFGELGFSERGIEGAVALRMSRDAVDALIDGHRVKLVVDLKPALNEEILRERIARERAELAPTEFFGELLRKLVPQPLVQPLARELDIHSKDYVSKITDAQVTRLIRTLKGLTFPITDYAPFEYAVTTAGGVRCEEVNPRTMESLKVPGLYLAGEVLDLDANTGGYNLQIAFSTGRLAGQLRKSKPE